MKKNKKKKLYTLPADWGSFVLETTYSTPDVRCPKVLVT